MAGTTWNPADKTTDCVLSNGNLSARSNQFGNQCARSVYGTATGKYYWEYTFVDAGNSACGIATLAALLTGIGVGGAAGVSYVVRTGTVYVGTTGVLALPAFSAGNVACMALDLTAQLIWFRNGAAGQWNNSGTANPATGTGGLAVSFVGAGVAAYGLYASNNATPNGMVTANFGDSTFVGAVPAGFTAGLAAPPAASTWSTTDKSASLTLTGGNLIATAGAGNVSGRGKDPKRTGKYYIEYTSTTTQNSASGVGFAAARCPLGTGSWAQAVANSAGAGSLFGYDNFAVQAISSPVGVTITTSTVVCYAIDLDARLIWIRSGAAGTWNINAANNPTTAVGGINLAAVGLGQGIDWYPFVYLGTSANSITANFGATAFTGAVPAGFTAGWDDSVSIVTNMVATQTVMEQWGSGVPAMWATQVLIEHWASVADAAPVVPSADTRVMVLA
jgi:hypothetical protein